VIPAILRLTILASLAGLLLSGCCPQGKVCPVSSYGLTRGPPGSFFAGGSGGGNGHGGGGHGR
jgi:hypothetical protein